MSNSTRFPTRNKSTSKDEATSTALAAVALQDHLVRSLNLGAPLSFGPRKIGLGPAAKAQKKQKKEIKSLTDTGLNRDRKAKKSSEAEKEYVLDEKPPPLTLAQKFGLVEAPEQPLTESDWQKAKEKSNKREDSSQPCVICKEDFGTQEQVLLSCTHVFHRACLQAFERFTGRKTCPMCRKEQYQTRVIYEGSKQHRTKCATLIQATWRMYVVRCWYVKLRESIPPTDPKLKKKYYADKLSSITDRIVKSCDFNIDVFLTEVDQNIAASRDIFRNFDAAFQILNESQWDDVQLKAVQRGHTECPICLGALGSYSYIDDRTSMPKSQTVQELYHSLSKPLPKPSKSHTTADDRSRNAKSPKSGPNGKGDSKKTESRGGEGSGPQKSRRTVLLSCSHVFHDVCLQTFEELALTEGRPQCPVCRSVYQKKIIVY